MRMERTGHAIALLTVMVGLAGGCSTTPSPTTAAPAETPVANELLAGAVHSKLNASPIYYYRHVDVRVAGGVAYLSGFVWSTDAIYAARRIAGSVPGVTNVVTTQLELERNGISNGVAR